MGSLPLLPLTLLLLHLLDLLSLHLLHHRGAAARDLPDPHLESKIAALRESGRRGAVSEGQPLRLQFSPLWSVLEQRCTDA